MSKIIMRRTMPGSMDGITINLYMKDREYEIDDQQITQSLANAFVDARWAKLIRTRSPLPSETAVIEVAPEIKDHPEPAILTEDEAEIEEKVSVEEPKNTRVFALAKELNTNWAEIKKVANQLGIDVQVAQSGLTDSEVKLIKENF